MTCSPDCANCARIQADIDRIQAENRDRIDAATDPEKDAVLRCLNDHAPDLLREAMDASEDY